MKGIVLAGGLGTRLAPMTSYVNKHLLPVYDRPMVSYPVELLAEAGITDVAVVVGGRGIEGFYRLLRNGEPFGLRRLRYLYQSGEGGIAAALRLAEDFADGEPVAVVLGDNIFLDCDEQIAEAIEGFGGGATLFLKDVDDPERFGVPEFSGPAGESSIVRVVEKPQAPASRLASTGLYLFDERAFAFARELVPSRRGELEIVDVHNRYAEAGELDYVVLAGTWLDAGTPDSMLRAARAVAERRVSAGAGAGTRVVGGAEREEG